MISKGSCDTEDWNNDAENSGINHILQYIQLENNSFFTILLFSLFQMHTALVSRKHLLTY